MIGDKKRNFRRYNGFTMVEMLLTMAILSTLFLAIGGVLQNMIKSSEYASSRMLVREEGEFLSEIFRKYLRNSSVDSVRLYHRQGQEPTIVFDDEYEVVRLGGGVIPQSDGSPATEIHFRPAGDSTGRVICIGFFRDQDEKGRIIKASGIFNDSWDDYQPASCFPDSPTPFFRKDVFVLSSDVVHIDNLEIQSHTANINIYYVIDIDIKPAWGWKALSKSLDDDKVKHRKTVYVETRQLWNW